MPGPAIITVANMPDNIAQQATLAAVLDRLEMGLVVGTAVLGASGNVANTNAVATLAGALDATTYITGFQCCAGGATGASLVTVTVAGLLGGTLSYTFLFPAGVTALAPPLIVTFPVPLPASAANTAIVVTLPAGGAGNTNATCNAQGYQL